MDLALTVDFKSHSVRRSIQLQIFHGGCAGKNKQRGHYAAVKHADRRGRRAGELLRTPSAESVNAPAILFQDDGVGDLQETGEPEVAGKSERPDFRKHEHAERVVLRARGREIN